MQNTQLNNLGATGQSYSVDEIKRKAKEANEIVADYNRKLSELKKKQRDITRKFVSNIDSKKIIKIKEKIGQL